MKESVRNEAEELLAYVKELINEYEAKNRRQCQKFNDSKTRAESDLAYARLTLYAAFTGELDNIRDRLNYIKDDLEAD